MARWLVVYDIANTSTREVGQGMVDGLRTTGNEVGIVPIHSYTELLLRGYDNLHKLPPGLKQGIFQILNELVYAKVGMTKADYVLVISGWVIASNLLPILREHFGCKSVLYLTESPYLEEDQLQQLHGYTLVLNNDPCNMAGLEDQHDNVMYFPHSWNPLVHAPKETTVPSGIDVFMCATGFKERQELLEAVDWDGITLCVKGIWRGMEKGQLCDSVQHGIMSNKDLPTLYANAKINLNIHRSSKAWSMETGEEQQYIDYAESLGPRVYEILASGGFLLTDYRKEMDGFLKDGENCAVFSDAASLEERVRFYLQNPVERERITRNGQVAVSNCTFAARCENLLFPKMEVSI